VRLGTVHSVSIYLRSHELAPSAVNIDIAVTGAPRPCSVTSQYGTANSHTSGTSKERLITPILPGYTDKTLHHVADAAERHPPTARPSCGPSTILEIPATSGSGEPTGHYSQRTVRPTSLPIHRFARIEATRRDVRPRPHLEAEDCGRLRLPVLQRTDEPAAGVVGLSLATFRRSDASPPVSGARASAPVDVQVQIEERQATDCNGTADKRRLGLLLQMVGRAQ
jgi:hypothetical protein